MTIVNRANRGGPKHSKGDLALAKISADWPEARDTTKEKVREGEANYHFSLEGRTGITPAFFREEFIAFSQAYAILGNNGVSVAALRSRVAGLWQFDRSLVKMIVLEMAYQFQIRSRA
jgi:hypothetical protein